MYKDIISYQLADGIKQSDLLKVAGEIIESWMNKQPGFIRREIHKHAENNDTYIVYWRSQ